MRCCVAGDGRFGFAARCALAAAAHVASSVRMRTRECGSRATAWRVQSAALRPGLTGRKGLSGRGPGLHPGLVDLALQAGIAGAALGASRDLTRHVCINLECHGAKRGAAFAFCGLVNFRRSRVFGLRAFTAPLRFRPVGPVPSAWHEMPGFASPECRRPARAVLSKKPT